MLNKKGEMTTQQIVTLIIVIVSFIIILFLIARLNLGEETDKELCHNSVVIRGDIASSTAVPLKCKTNYICITQDGSCEKMSNPKIERVSTKEETYNVLAKEMADCWWMFGEGKVDYIGSEVLKENYCSICSQFAFDDSLKEIEDFETGILSKDDFYDYLAGTNMAGGEKTYAEYFFATNDLNGLKKQTMEATNQQGDGTFGEINLDKQYYNTMGITSEIDDTYEWIGAAGVAVGAVVVFATPLGWVGTAIVAASVAVGVGGGKVASQYEPEILALTVKGRGIENEFMAPTIIEANSQQLEKLNCKSIKTLA